MKLVVIAVGRLKEKHYREACAEYSRRLAVLRPVEVIEIPEEPVSDSGSLSLVAKALEREALRILARLRPEDLVCALTPAGQLLDSAAFAREIDAISQPDVKRMVFILGGSHGLAPAVYARCNRQLSFGPMTFPRQLARVMLLEQIYRGQMISLGRLYHK